MTDYIKREDAIQAFDPLQRQDWYTPWIVETLKELPSADVVPVVRCKDCRWWDNSEDSPHGYCMAMKHGYMSEKWEIGIYRRYKGDFYCADAERKDNG